jgi:hypothetical protein
MHVEVASVSTITIAPALHTERPSTTRVFVKAEKNCGATGRRAFRALQKRKVVL